MGSGTSVQEINKLLRQYKQMQIMMKRVKKLGHKQFMGRGLPPGLPPGLLQRWLFALRAVGRQGLDDRTVWRVAARALG
jgi:Signal peptide binding domain